MAQQVTSLREANNYVTIEGYLEENNLEKKVLNEGTKDEREVIAGDLVISTDENSRYKVKFFANRYRARKTEDAPLEESKMYKSLETVISEYISRAKALSEGISEDDVTKVTVNGAKIGINDYYNEEKHKMYSTVELRANFVNRVKGEFKPRATFDVETYFESIEKEIVDEKETGRVKVNGIVPVYNGAVIPVTFYSTEDTTYGDIGKYLLDNYSAGKSGSIGGSIRCVISRNTQTVSGFGAPVERTFTNYSYEYIIERGAAEQYLITDPKNFDKATIKVAMQYREEQLEQKKQKTNSNPSGGFGATAVSNKTKELDF